MSLLSFSMRFLALSVPCALAAAALAPHPALAIAAPDARAVCRAPGGIVVAKSENAAACNKLGVGAYQVIVGNNVSACTFVATLAGTGAAAAGEIGVTQGSANNRVRVQTRNSAGAAADRAFHLVVAC